VPINSTRQYTAGTLALLTTVIIWGVQFPIAKDTFETVNAFHSAIFRFGLPAIIMMIALAIVEGQRAFRPDKELRAVAVLGVLGMCVTPSLIFGGLMFTRPEIAAIVVASQPILSIVVQRLWHKEKTDLTSFLCVLLAFTGIITVITRWDLSLQISAREMTGNVMVLIGALCWVVYTMACGKYTHWSTLRLTAWLLGAINAMLFINLIPIVTIVFRYFQGYRFTVIELFGAALVIVALLTQNLALRRKMMVRGN